MERSPEIEAILGQIYRAVSTGDTDTLQTALSAHDGVTFIGTDPNEWFEEPGAIKAMLAAQAAAGVTVKGGTAVGYEEGTVGWVADRGVFVLPDGSEAPFRITVVFHREDGRWKLVQEHASIAASNEDVIGAPL